MKNGEIQQVTLLVGIKKDIQTIHTDW